MQLNGIVLRIINPYHFLLRRVSKGKVYDP